MRLWMIVCMCLSTLVLGGASPAESQPTIYVLTFRADWCPMTRLLEPRLKTALAKTDPKAVQAVRFDLSNRAGKNAAAQTADALNLRLVYDRYAARTGFAVIIRAEDRTVVQKITPLMSDAEIGTALTKATYPTRLAATP